ncbi:MAG: AAA family ATPase [Actinomycetota bacterium]|nr:AAA family ATPase [Actinomycetota bacterium]
MKLNRLSLENYRCFGKINVDFPGEGLIGILGKNGVGKSSLMEAVAWILYGNFAARTEKEQITTTGANHCEGVLEIEVNGSSYQIMRQMKGKTFTSDAAVHHGKSCMARGVKPTEAFVKELLGMDLNCFYASFFAKQKELNYLSDLRPEERRSFIIRLLGIGPVDEARADVRQEIRGLEAQLGVLDTQKVDIAEVKAKLNLAEEVMAKAEREKIAQGTQIEGLKKTAKEKRASLVKMEKARDAHDKLTSLWNSTKTEYKIVQERLEEARGGIKRAEEAEKKFQELAGAEKNAQKAQGTYHGLLQRVETVKEKIQELNHSLERIEAVGSEEKCPVCTKPLGEEGLKKAKQHLTEELERSRESLLGAERAIPRAKAEAQKVQEEADQAKLFARDASTLDEIRKRAAEEKTRLEELAKELERIKKEGKALGFDKKAHEEKKGECDRAIEALHKAEIKARDLEHEVERGRDEIARTKEKIAEAEKTSKLTKDIQEKMAKNNKLAEVLGAFRTHLIGRIRPALSEKASELLTSLTDNKYEGLLLDEDYNILIEDEGASYSLNRYSGGEKDLANFCLRLAISQLLVESRGMRGTNFIVLDEIFGSQDEGRRNNLLDALSMVSNIFGQIFVITHLDEEKEKLETIFEVVEEGNHSVIRQQ